MFALYFNNINITFPHANAVLPQDEVLVAIAEGRADYLEEPKLVGQPTKEEMREWQKDARKAEGLPDVEEAVTRGI